MARRPRLSPHHYALVVLLLGCSAEPADGRAPERTDRDASASTTRATDDPAVRDARAALGEGRAYLATRLIEPALRDSARRTPDVVLLAATAAGEWGGWGTVERLLRDVPWLDRRFEGAGRALLARAALARGADSLAAEHARLASEQAATNHDRGVRTALLARALDRLDRRAGAAAAYARAGTLLPEVRSWLALRAAAVTDDSAARARVLAAITLPHARGRAPLVDAQARERAGDWRGAATALAALGSDGDALRLRLRDARERGDRAGIAAARAGMVTLLERRRGSAQAHVAAETLESTFTSLRPRERLLVARTLARTGEAAQAARAYAAALGAGAGDGSDRLAYARLLFRMDRYRDAAAHFARVPSTHAEGGAAAYERARALLRDGKATAARTALRAIPRRFPRDEASARALFLLADMAADEGRDAAARRALRELAARFPNSPLAPRARFTAAIIAYVDGAYATAAAELDTLRQRYPRGGEASAATYWSGRAWHAAGRRDTAHQRWRELTRQDELSYYAALAARRLGTTPWRPAAAADSLPVPADVGGAIARAATLEELGMTLEARLEYDEVARLAGTDPTRLLATAAALQARELSSRGIRLASRARDRGAAADARLLRRLYPVVHGNVLAAESRERGLDPALVAGLIRQESNFEPRATSPAGARGLMQLMPRVGTAIARGMSFPVWDTALLWEPDVNLRLGAAHLATLVRQYDRLEHVLAAYNAGGSRVSRWRERRGADDPELFTERIPYPETRDYVRLVLRNRDLYRALYGWRAPAGAQQSGR